MAAWFLHNTLLVFLSIMSLLKKNIVACCISLLFLAVGTQLVLANHPISNTLYKLLEDGDYDKAKASISAYKDNDVANLPDSIKFDYFYLRGAIAQNDGNRIEKLKYLTKAKICCEDALGIHSPVYLELCWSVGKDLAELGDTVSAFEIYQSAIVQSIGLYDMSDQDVAWQYEDMNNRVIEWYKNDSIRNAMIKHRSQLAQRSAKNDAIQNDMEFYLRFYNDEALKVKLQYADSLNATDRYSEAAAIYKNISDNVNDSPIAKATINSLAAADLINMNDFRGAEELLLENLRLLNHCKTAKAYRRTLSELSNLYIAIHNYEKAKNYAGMAKYIYEHCLDFSRGYIICLHRCSSIERGSENYFLSLLLEDVALQEYYKNSVWGQISGKMTEREYFHVNMLSSAALHYNQVGFNDDAKGIIESAISIAERYGWYLAPLYNNLAEICLAVKDFDGALNVQKKSYELCNDDRQRVEIGTKLGIVQFFAKSKIDSNVLMSASKGLNNQTTETFAFLSTDERRDYWNYFQYHLPMLNFLIYQCDDKNLYGDIYNNILHEKGLLLRASTHIRQEIERSGNKKDLAEYDRLLALRRIRQTQTNNEDFSSEIDDIDKYLTKKYTSYSTFNKSLKVSWQDIAHNLGDNDIAIEFYNIPEAHWNGNDLDASYRYCAVTLKKGYDTPHIIPLCKKQMIDGLFDDDYLYNNKAYELVWQPLETELADVHNVYFSADGDLHKLAIEYIDNPNDNIMNDVYCMYRLSSTRVLAETIKSSTSQNAVLYGGLKYDLNLDDLLDFSKSKKSMNATRSGDFTNLRYGVTYLPNTLTEVNDIASLFKSSQKGPVKSIIGIEGTEESFKALAGQPIDIIHLATHGFYWTENKAEERNYVSFLSNRDISAMRAEDYSLLRSGLFFSGANIGLRGDYLPDDVEDGVLTAQELSNMNLGNVDMVVMSACQSGLGEVSGDGVFGLQRGFKLAGANTLLMSLWKVDDEATYLLMTEFYKHLLAGKSKRESLSLAQQTLRNNTKYSDPEYWASFILLDALN